MRPGGLAGHPGSLDGKLENPSKMESPHRLWVFSALCPFVWLLTGRQNWICKLHLSRLMEIGRNGPNCGRTLWGVGETTAIALRPQPRRICRAILFLSHRPGLKTQQEAAPLTMTHDTWEINGISRDRKILVSWYGYVYILYIYVCM